MSQHARHSVLMSRLLQPSPEATERWRQSTETSAPATLQEIATSFPHDLLSCPSNRPIATVSTGTQG